MAAYVPSMGQYWLMFPRAEKVAPPIPPTITGSAPDGAQGVAWPGYAYTVTAGSAAIVSVSIVGGSLPDGLVWDEVTRSILPGTPTDGGNFSWVIQVVDANGLMSTLEDGVSVTASISFDDEYRYTVETGGPANNNDYSAVDFDDSIWNEGRGGFGNSASAQLAGHTLNTPVAGGNGKIIWLRRAVVANPGRALRVDAYHDDGFALWWNGERITMTDIQYFHAYAVIPGDKVLDSNVVALKVIDGYTIDGTPSGSSNIYAAIEVREADE